MLLCSSNKIELGQEEKINRDQIRRWRSDKFKEFYNYYKSLDLYHAYNLQALHLVL